MNDNLERYIMITVLAIVVVLVLWAAGSQLALQAYEAGTTERATLAARGTQIVATLTAIR